MHISLWIYSTPLTELKCNPIFNVTAHSVFSLNPIKPTCFNNKLNSKKISIWTDTHEFDKLTPISIHNIIFIFIEFKRISCMDGLTIFFVQLTEKWFYKRRRQFSTLVRFTSTPHQISQLFGFFHNFFLWKERKYYSSVTKELDLWYDFFSSLYIWRMKYFLHLIFSFYL